MYETCTGSIISFFQFSFKNIVPPDQKSWKKLKKNEIIEPVQVSCTLTPRRIEIIEPVQVLFTSPPRKSDISELVQVSRLSSVT